MTAIEVPRNILKGAIVGARSGNESWNLQRLMTAGDFPGLKQFTSTIQSSTSTATAKIAKKRIREVMT